MADANIDITAGTGTSVDTRTEATNGHHRQVIVIGDPSTNAGVAPVDATAGLKVDLGADNDITGTVTANLSATDNAVLDAIEVDTTAIAGDTTTIAGDTTSIDAKIPALGQALAAASVPVVLTAAQITTLTPPAAITGFGTSANQTTIIGHLDGVEGLLTTIDSDTGTIATEVAGLLTDTELRATPVPVSGTITANLSATDNAVLDDIALDTEAIKTSLAGTLTVTGGGGGTEYTEDVATANPIVGTATMIERDDALSTVTPIEGDNIGLRGTAEGALWTQDFNSDGILADTTAIKTSLETAGGQLVNLGANNDVTVTGTVAVTQSGTWDEVGINDSGNSITVDNAQLSVVGTGTEATAMRVTIASDSTGVLSVDDNGGALTVDGTVTANLAAGTNNIGDVDILSIATGDNNIGNVDIVSGTITTVSTVTSVTAIANALPAGTNAIGKLAANSGVDIGDVTLTANSGVDIGSVKGLPSDIDINGSNANHADKYYTNTGAVTDGIVWSPAAGKRWHILTLYINVSAAATVTLEDDLAAGDNARWKAELAANSGVIIKYDKEHPFCSGEDAADLIITTSAGNVYVQAVGYEI